MPNLGGKKKKKLSCRGLVTSSRQRTVKSGEGKIYKQKGNGKGSRVNSNVSTSDVREEKQNVVNLFEGKLIISLPSLKDKDRSEDI